MNSMALPRRHRGPKIQHTLLQNLTRREKSLTEGCGNYLGGREGSIRGMTDRLPVQGRADDLDRGSLVLQSARRRRTGARRRSCRARLEPDARSTTRSAVLTEASTLTPLRGARHGHFSGAKAGARTGWVTSSRDLATDQDATRHRS